MKLLLLFLFLFFCGLLVDGFSKSLLKRIPDKMNLKYNLNGLKIRTVFMNDPAFLRLKRIEGRNLDKRNINKIPWEGIIPDIYEGLAHILNFTFSLYQPKDGKFGNFNETSGKWNGLIREIQEDRADVIAAGIVASLERSSAVDFSFPTYTASHVFLVAKGSSDYSFIMFFKPLTFHVWIGVYALIMLSSVVIFITVKYSRDQKIHEFSIHKSIIYSLGAFGAFASRRWSLTPQSSSGR